MFRHLHLSVVSDPYLRLKTDKNGILKALEGTEAKVFPLPSNGDKVPILGFIDSDNSRACVGGVTGVYYPV